MSIDYDLLDTQIEELGKVELSMANRPRMDAIVGLLNLLEYIRDEQSSANLNAYKDSSDHADNRPDSMQPVV